MIYALAAIGALTVTVLMWRAFGPVRDAAGDGPATTPPRRAPLAPDDDPEFLRRLAEQQRDKKNDEQG